MIKIALVIGLAFVIQFVLSSFQMKNFNNEFVRLRRKGKVAIGRKSGGFHAGAIVMFRIDEKGIIQESRKIEGTTFLARVKDFPGFEGRYVGDLSVNDVEKSHKNLRKAVEDAALTYKKYMAGEEIAQPPSNFQKAGNAFHLNNIRAAESRPGFFVRMKGKTAEIFTYPCYNKIYCVFCLFCGVANRP